MSKYLGLFDIYWRIQVRFSENCKPLGVNDIE